MQQTIDHIDKAYLKRTPPRPLPSGVVVKLLSDRVIERTFRTFLNPVLIVAVIVLIAMVAIHTRPVLWLVPLSVIVVRLTASAGQRWLDVWDEITLLRKGLVARAHILKLRPHRTVTGEIDGVLLDIAIPVGPRRTHIGSVWFADGNEALRLTHKGRVEVVYLPREPATWRVIEEVQSELRYERMGRIPNLPQEVI